MPSSISTFTAGGHILRLLLTALLLSVSFAAPADAQSEMGGMQHDMHDMAAMSDDGGDAVPEADFSPGSGSSRLPGNGDAMQGLHVSAGDWMIMAHGYAWGVYTDQGGRRGDDQVIVQSMGMIEASTPLGDGARLQLRSMLSLEPLMGDHGYPNLFATGETAGGAPLVDRQHPHDFFMELSGRLDVDIAPDATIFLYGGPVAEPALGPAAFMHRGSSRYNPDAPISHHWFDSTHISFGVVTAGISSRHFQLEASAFRGREPDERRWDIETPKLDSWSVRGTWNPSPAWSAQLSYGHLQSPEALHPDEDEGRLTASVSYAGQGIDATAGFSAKNRLPGHVLEAWFAEANYAVNEHHNLFGRVEAVENDELFDDDSPLHGRTFRVAKFTAGYAYSLPLRGALNLALGGSGSLYAVPDRIRFAYGSSPKSFTLFAKLSLGK